MFTAHQCAWRILAAVGRLPYVALAATLLAESVLLVPPPFALTDHIVLWYVGRLIVSGRSPYEPAAWVEAAAQYDSPHLRELAAAGGVGVWPYPPWTGFLFVPFGALPLEVGTWALHAALVAVGLAAGVALARQIAPTSGPLAVALVLFATFQPFLIAARWGQFSSFVLAGAALAFAGARSRRGAPVAAGLLLLSTKPHVTVLLGLAVLGLLAADRAWRAIGISAAALAAVAALAWWRHPEWVGATVTGATDRVAALDRFASTWSFARELNPAWPVGALLVAGALAACALAARWAPGSARRQVVFAAGAVASVVATPYVLSYDHLLLAPAALIAVLALSATTPGLRLLQAVAVLLVVTAVPWLAYLAGIFRPTQSLSGVVPLVFALLLLASAALLRARAPRAS